MDTSNISREIKIYNTLAWSCLLVAFLFFAGVVLSDLFIGWPFGHLLLLLLLATVLTEGALIFFQMRNSLRDKIELQNLLLSIQKSLEEKKDK